MDEIKMAVELGQAGLFLWLYLRVDARLEKQNERHDADIARVTEQRVNELKLIARLSTDLTAEYSMPAIPRVKA